MPRYIVYKYTTPSGKSYIGRTNNESRRKTQHKVCVNAGSLFPIHVAMRKYGYHNMVYSVIVRNVPLYLINPFEKYWINHCNSFNNGYNCTIGGEGVSGRRHSDEAKRLISIARKGNTDWKGRSHTLDAIKKISDSKIGGRNPAAIPVINLDTGEVYCSGSDAARAIGLCTRAITKAIRKSTKSGGYRWAKYNICEVN